MKHSDTGIVPYKKAKLISILLAVWTICVCSIPNIVLSVTEDLSLAQRLANTLLPCGIYVLLMSLTRNVGKATLWMFPLMFFAAFQIVLLYMFGRSVIAVDMFLNLVTTNPAEVNELLGNMGVIILVVCLLYLPPLAGGIAGCVKKWRITGGCLKNIRLCGYALTGAGLICFAASFASARPYRPLNDLYPLNMADNIYRAVERTARVERYKDTSRRFRFGASSTRPADEREVYVIVIGETSRAPQWQLLGYDRANNAPLMDLPGLTAFNRAVSESNTTHKSVPMLLSDVDAHTFEDSIYSRKSIISAFKEAGYSTAFFSNQARNHSFIDFFGSEADTCIFIKEQTSDRTGHPYDGELINRLRSHIASTAGKSLIVLHTYGSHFSYLDRYPDSARVFTPDSPLDVSPKNRAKLINAYDNTIAYTASLLRDVADVLKAEDCRSAMFYTSDHGEDIYDDSRGLFLHASPVPSYYQLHVPFLVWLSDKYISDTPEHYQALQDNKNRFISTSGSLFHTVADIAGIAMPRHFDESRSVASSRYKERPPIYLNDHNEGVSLSACGLRPLDLIKFDSIGISLR
ncbi:MAG: lipid A phosphoethanolamine transferase [Muribaculaceae bacterium]|nr:lipid A phosphoethanolamine transferase [Muribaculaceae bacterium]